MVSVSPAKTHFAPSSKQQSKSGFFIFNVSSLASPTLGIVLSRFLDAVEPHSRDESRYTGHIRDRQSQRAYFCTIGATIWEKPHHW
jgi:hypothetical protein